MADIDWSQFSTEPPAPAPSGVDWSQFSDTPPGVDAGPPRANDFSNVQVGAQQNMHPDIGTLGRWQSMQPTEADMAATEQRVNRPLFDVDAARSGVQGIGEDYPYPNDQVDVPKPAGMRGHDMTLDLEKHRVGATEGFIRQSLAKLGEFGEMASKLTPAGAIEYAAASVTGHQTPGAEAVEAIKFHPETEQYTGARAEAVSEFGSEMVANFMPLEGTVAAGAKAFRFLGAEKRAAEAAHDAALLGEAGPAAQGAATANEITAQAMERRPPKAPGEMDITPEMRVPAEEAPNGPVPVPDATLDRAAAEAAPGEAAQLPSGVAPERGPAPAPEERPPGGPDLGMAPAQPAPEPLYHASLSPDIEQFDLARSGSQSDPGVLGQGIYARGDEKTAPYFLGPQKDQGTLYRLEHSMENPKEFDSPQAAIEWQGERGTDSPEAAARIRQKYEAAGHDGVIIRNPQTGKILEAAVFDPAKVRVAEKRPIKQPAQIAPIEVPHAEDVRVDQGPTGGQREVPAGREVGGRGDLQQAREAEGNAVPEQLRGAGEARGNAEAVPELTGVKKAVVTDERARRGLEEVKHDLFRSDAEGMRRAQEKIDANPNYGRDLTEELVRNPRPISKEETFALMHDRTRIISERRAAYEEAERAMDAGDVEGAAQARARVDRLDEEYSQNDHAATVSGHEWAEGGRARQRMMAPDYSMAALVREAKVKKGADLTPAEIREVEARAKEVEAREAALDKREAELNAREAKPTSSAGSRRAQKTFDSLAEELRNSSRAILCELAERAA